jgi:hypothetical protein
LRLLFGVRVGVGLKFGDGLELELGLELGIGLCFKVDGKGKEGDTILILECAVLLAAVVLFC